MFRGSRATATKRAGETDRRAMWGDRRKGRRQSVRSISPSTLYLRSRYVQNRNYIDDRDRVTGLNSTRTSDTQRAVLGNGIGRSLIWCRCLIKRLPESTDYASDGRRRRKPMTIEMSLENVTQAGFWAGLAES